RRADAYQVHRVRLPGQARLRAGVGRSGGELLSPRQLASALVRRDRRRAPRRTAVAVTRARTIDDDRARRIAVPVFRVRFHERELLCLRSVDGEPCDAAPRAAYRGVHGIGVAGVCAALDRRASGARGTYAARGQLTAGGYTAPARIPGCRAQSQVRARHKFATFLAGGRRGPRRNARELLLQCGLPRVAPP